MDDDFKYAEFFESGDGDGEATAQGIAQCLRLLADEAAALGLARTVAALQAALAVCTTESEGAADMDPDEDEVADVFLGYATASTKLH